MTLASLLTSSMAGGSDAEERPAPAGYDFKNPPTKMLDVISLSCRGRHWQDGLGIDGGLHGAWLYLGLGGWLVLRWYDETILVLDRVAAEAWPHASFDCSKVTSPAETTICRSRQLAAFDRSVAAAYKVARDAVNDDAEQVNQLLAAQRAWIHHRDACRSEVHCLMQSLKNRLGKLVGVGQG